ncbi:MAG: NAD(P)-dependent oxidoreductase [Lachnospiraceae bacterium]|nr:NAD(P)-dependent oxidoreductase [Lachnospiraceae bacterium]
MRIVITGPTGTIGMALIHQCIKEKKEVLAICHRNSANMKKIPQSSYVTVLEADLSELKDLVVPDKKYDVFYHLAWAGTTGNERNDMRLQLFNISCSLDAVHLAKRLGCSTFVGAGSQAEYGRFEGKLTADTPAFPENGYGMAKLCAGQMSRAECKKLGLKCIWVRILSVYGPFGSNNSMINGTVQKLLSGQSADFTSGEQIWDYLYCEDAAKALSLAAQKGKDGKVYVLGSGKGRALKEYIDILSKAVTEVTGRKADVRLGAVPYAENQIMHLEADVSELAKDTGFTPEIFFEEGVRRTIAAIYNEIQHTTEAYKA